jgi:hypothetical protein
LEKNKIKKRSRSSSLFSKTLDNLPDLGSIEDKKQIQFGKRINLPNPQKQNRKKKKHLSTEREIQIGFPSLSNSLLRQNSRTQISPRLPARCVDSTPATFRNPVNKTSQRARAGERARARGEDAASFPPASVQTPFAFALYPSVHYQRH